MNVQMTIILMLRIKENVCRNAQLVPLQHLEIMEPGLVLRYALMQMLGLMIKTQKDDV